MFFVCFVVFIIVLFTYFPKREKKKVWDWVGGKIWMIWEEMGEGKIN